MQSHRDPPMLIISVLKARGGLLLQHKVRIQLQEVPTETGKTLKM